jgi:hypothetical protein
LRSDEIAQCLLWVEADVQSRQSPMRRNTSGSRPLLLLEETRHVASSAIHRRDRLPDASPQRRWTPSRKAALVAPANTPFSAHRLLGNDWVGQRFPVLHKEGAFREGCGTPPFASGQTAPVFASAYSISPPRFTTQDPSKGLTAGYLDPLRGLSCEKRLGTMGRM